jgi:hypothetical protein
VPKLTKEDRERIKSTHPEAMILRSPQAPGHDFVFRPVKVAELDAFLGAVNGDDSTAKIYAHRSLAADCVVFPSREDFNAFAKEKPAVAHALGDELARKAGLRAEVQSEEV